MLQVSQLVSKMKQESTGSEESKTVKQLLDKIASLSQPAACACGGCPFHDLEWHNGATESARAETKAQAVGEAHLVYETVEGGTRPAQVKLLSTFSSTRTMLLATIRHWTQSRCIPRAL